MSTIIDYAINNLRSVEKAFQGLGVAVEASDDPCKIGAAEKLVLPGVGAFADAMNNLKAKKLQELIRERVGRTLGFNFIPGKVKRLPADLKVPHIGWNQLHVKRPDPLLEGISEGSFVYFVHSYYAEPEETDDVLATTDYGMEFAAIARKGNVWATQFHPEKSQEVGLRLLRNFAMM